ncbi:antibiotic biosynthesis monooxygenase [Thalassospira marina]|uniref:Antibiotic biosynthesis monooxygenase n=1 Tax=Thalassospira marina TaxID=2048283 RepID=A0ABM6QC59_9PROT|nr:antibiotic biosynthesis monooxygenase [Thalassospira marina]
MPLTDDVCLISGFALRPNQPPHINKDKTMIIILGHIHIPPADVGNFMDDIQAITPVIGDESGCYHYAVALKDAEQGQVVVAERWRDQPALGAHLAKPETVALMAKWDGKLQADIHKFDASNMRGLFDQAL